tara:strand:+ start:496 stop:684 length:189 start_codon:yes stop_codon:yes gene_type:complete
MTAKTSTTNTKLQSEVDTLKQQNAQLSNSVSSLKDDIVSLRTQVNTFKRMVSEDIKKIVEKL